MYEITFFEKSFNAELNSGIFIYKALKEVEEQSRTHVQFMCNSATDASAPLLIPCSCRPQVAHQEANSRS